MARTKTKRLPSTATTRTAAAKDIEESTARKQTPQQRRRRRGGGAHQEEEEEEKTKEEECESLISMLTSATRESLRFLSSKDLLLHPSQSLALSSLLTSSARSLSSLIPLLPNPKIPPPPPHRNHNPHHFSWFRRFLASSSSPSDPRWLENFRMSKPSFYLLLQTLSPSLLSLSSSPTPIPIPPDHKLAATLFRLAHSAPFSFVSRRFGLTSPSLACRSFYEVCRAISDHLGHLFELSSDLSRILQGFNWMSLPNCCGSLSFARIPLQPSSSIVAQCLVDSECRFLDVSVGWHGAMSPEEILPKTKLYTAQSFVLGPGRVELSRGMSVPRYFIGGSCCPLLPWLLTPFTLKSDSGSDSKAVVFNTVHARGMELADRAFARLRARWKILSVEWKEECAEALPYVVVTCCLLHNYLIKCSEPVPDEGDISVVDVGFAEFEGKGDGAGERIRNVLASHLSQVIHK